MIVGVPKEIKNEEYRVAVTPNGVKEFVRAGHTVFVEKGAGVGSGFDDAAYKAAGATLAKVAEVFAKSDMIVKVKEPLPGEWPMFKKGQILYTYLHLGAAYAKDLTDGMLEEVRLLSNLETDDRKLLQIVLLGQPELRDRLDRPELRQLRQRITVRYHLGPIEPEETEAYILHRLTVAGANGRPTFTPAAVRAIHRHSRGVPRLINAVCDKTLLAGYVDERDRLGWWQVRRAVRDLEGDDR